MQSEEGKGREKEKYAQSRGTGEINGRILRAGVGWVRGARGMRVGFRRFQGTIG